MRQSAMDSPPVQPMSSRTSRHGLGDHHVARRDAERQAIAREGRRRAVDGEHGRSCRHGVTPRRPRRSVAVDPLDARSLVEANARASTLSRSPRASRAGCTFAAVRRSRPPPRKSGDAQRARHLVFAERSRLLGCADLRALVDEVVPIPDLGVRRGDVERRGPDEPGVDPFATRTRPRSRRRLARMRGTPRPPASRRRGRAGSGGRPTGSRRSRRSSHSARAPRAPRRARRRRSRARALSAARQSRDPGSRRRRRRRRPSCPPRAARSARRALPLRASSRSACAARSPPRQPTAAPGVRSGCRRPTPETCRMKQGGGRDLNPRPPGSQPGALPTELPPPRATTGYRASRARPRSSVDRAVDFESTRGGSIPPGAIRRGGLVWVRASCGALTPGSGVRRPGRTKARRTAGLRMPGGQRPTSLALRRLPGMRRDHGRPWAARSRGGGRLWAAGIRDDHRCWVAGSRDDHHPWTAGNRGDRRAGRSAFSSHRATFWPSAAPCSSAVRKWMPPQTRASMTSLSASEKRS